MPEVPRAGQQQTYSPPRIRARQKLFWKGKSYFLIVTFAVGAIFIASPVSGVTTTSSIDTIA